MLLPFVNFSSSNVPLVKHFLPSNLLFYISKGHSRHSSTARVPQLSTEDASQEQNVPQHIDLTGDDEEDNVDNDDVIDQNVLSVGPQEENDLFEDVYVYLISYAICMQPTSQTFFSSIHRSACF